MNGCLRMEYALCCLRWINGVHKIANYFSESSLFWVLGRLPDLRLLSLSSSTMCLLLTVVLGEPLVFMLCSAGNSICHHCL